MHGKVEKRTTADGRTVFTQRVELPPDPATGQRKRTRITAATEKELNKKVLAKLKEIESGTVVDRSERTVGEFLEYWLAHAIRGAKRETTAESYAEMVRRILKPRLGSVRLQTLHQSQIQRTYSELLANGRSDGKGGLSARTVRYAHMVLLGALRDGVSWGMVGRNVAELAEPPRSSSPEMTVWTEAEVEAFLSQAAKDPYEPVWSLLATTGMRRGEVLGLRWGDVDLERGEVHVRRALVRTDDGRAVISGTKTKRGTRMIVLFPAAVEALKEAKKRAAERALKSGTGWDPNAPVCATNRGTMILPDNLRRKFRVLCEAAGVPVIRIHDLRHTHATILLKRNVHPKVVQERLGHSSIAETMDRYTHLLPSIQRDAIGEILGRFEGDESSAESGS